jgi:hypothetical protein
MRDGTGLWQGWTVGGSCELCGLTWRATAALISTPGASPRGMSIDGKAVHTREYWAVERRCDPLPGIATREWSRMPASAPALYAFL